MTITIRVIPGITTGFQIGSFPGSISCRTSGLAEAKFAVFRVTKAPEVSFGNIAMAIRIECNECGYQGNFDDSKRLKTVACPECNEPISISGLGTSRHRAKSSRPISQRVQSNDSNTAGIFLLGAIVLAAGVGLMFVIRLYNIPKEDLTAASNSVIYGDLNEEPPEASTNTESVVPIEIADDQEDHSELDLTAPETLSVQQPSDQPDSKLNTNAGKADDSEPTAVIAISPQQLLMARMTELVVNVIGFPEDVRGNVASAIESSTNGAMQSCKLSCVKGADKPVMQVSLKLINDAGARRLSVAAELQANMQGIPVKLWERTDTLITIDDKALNNGILPPNLSRSLSDFFTTLRSDLVDARRAVIRMENTKKNRVDDSL